MSEPNAPHLRDARLAHALRHAPDADATPSPALSSTIKTIAASALPTCANGQFSHKKTWWHALWASSGSARGPWGGALATLVLGCIITAMWYGQELPTEVPQAASVAAPASTAAPAPVPATAPSPVADAALAPLTPSAAKPAPPMARVAAPPAQARAPTEELARRQDRAEVPTEKYSVEPAQREANAASPAPKVAAATAAPLAAAGLAPAPLAAPAPAAAPPAAPSSAAGASVGALHKSRAITPSEWRSAALQYQGRNTPLDTVDAQRLGSYVMAAVNTATPQTRDTNLAPALPTTTAPSLRIALVDASGTQAVLSVREGTLLWQRPGQADVTGTPQVDALAQLMDYVRSVQKPN